MADEELRTLDRKVRTGEASAIPALARACQRLGRQDDFLLAVMSAHHHAGVRGELTREWSRRCPMHTSWVDLAPVLKEPCIRWETKLGGLDLLDRLLVSPLAIVAITKRRVVLLDPTTGTIRRELPAAVSLGMMGTSLLHAAANGALVAHDLWTAEPIWEATIEAGSPKTMKVAGDALLVGNGRRVALYRVTDALAHPIEPMWERTGRFSLASSLLTRDHVILETLGALTILDHAGHELGRIRLHDPTVSVRPMGA